MDRDYSKIALSYAERVVAGKEPACSWVRLACERHLRDLERKDWEWIWREKAGNHICGFVEVLPHVKGKWRTPRIRLEPWQCFLLTVLFGWRHKETGLRRFRKALVVVPRKNSKSTLAAAVGLYLLSQDDEPGAEIYSAATTRDQARISWEMARAMVQRTTPLMERYGLQPLAHSIAIENEGKFFKPLSRDADSLEGLNVHGAIIDELHAHKTRDVFDVLDDATGSRRQPLLFIISTEGDNSEGVFAEQVDYCRNILAGTLQDETYFGIIYTIDPEDDWTYRESWKKANPNYGVSVFERDLEVRCEQAKANPASQSSFLTKRLNVRVGASGAYFNMLAWRNACLEADATLDDFAGQPCIITLDLASKSDLTAKIYTFRRGPIFYVFGRYYLPEDAIKPGSENYEYYAGWQRSGKLFVTPGNITDYGFVEEELLEDLRVRRLRPIHVGVDPNYNAGQFTTRMTAEGVPMIEVRHNTPTFSEPMKELAAMVIAGRVRHNGDPVLTWAMGNVLGKEDAKGNVYPVRERRANKIDPAVALIANMSLQMRQATTQESVYNYGFPI